MAQNHKDKIHDTDPRCSIDPITRAIINETSQKFTLVKGDHNSERFSFSLPRLIDKHDMSLCNRVRVHYINIDQITKEQSADCYEVDDLHIDPDDENVVVFSWLVAGTATVYAGSLSFGVTFECLDGDKVQYRWSTAPNTSIRVSDGFDNAPLIIEEYSDILQTWWDRLYSTSSLPIEVRSMEEFQELTKKGEVKPDTLYLLEDDPTLEEVIKTSEDAAKALEDVSTTIKDVEDLKEGIAAIEVETAAIKEDITTNEAELVAIETEIAAIKERVETIEDTNETFNAAEEIAAIKEDIVAIEIELGHIGGEVSTIKSDDLYRLDLFIAGLREDLTTLNSKVEDDYLKKSGGTIDGNLTVVGALNATATRAHNATKAESATEADHATRADNVDTADSANKLAGCKSAQYDVRADGFIIAEYGVYLLIGHSQTENSESFVTDVIAIPYLTEPAYGSYVGNTYVSAYENTEFGYRLRFNPQASSTLTGYSAYKIMDL